MFSLLSLLKQYFLLHHNAFSSLPPVYIVPSVHFSGISFYFLICLPRDMLSPRLILLYLLNLRVLSSQASRYIVLNAFFSYILFSLHVSMFVPTLQLIWLYLFKSAVLFNFYSAILLLKLFSDTHFYLRCISPSYDSLRLHPEIITYLDFTWNPRVPFSAALIYNVPDVCCKLIYLFFTLSYIFLLISFLFS